MKHLLQLLQNPEIQKELQGLLQMGTDQNNVNSANTTLNNFQNPPPQDYKMPMAQARQEIASPDWKSLDDFDFMTTMDKQGVAYEDLNPEGQARFKKFMDDEPKKAKQMPLPALKNNYRDSSRPSGQIGLSGLMSLATSGIKRR